MDLISMTCRNCGGKLKISKDTDQFICQHCGTEYLVSFTEGAISIKLLSQGIQKIRASTDKTASELALVRIKDEKNILMDRWGMELYTFLQDLKMNSIKVLNQYPMVTKDDGQGPEVYLILLDSLLESEESKIIRNQKRISELKRMIEKFNEYDTRWNDLLQQETDHRKIVNHP